ncbi:MAG: carboxylating nicotinate-nucleotide diphosphorylase [Pelagibacterales bacterium]|nr:carboxylating nicotinate-nucleotide diphosphorylase [Pelagibacterales bacterium]
MIGNTKPTLNQKYIRSIVKSAMLEDLSPHGDVTTQLIKSKKKFKAKIISNQKGIIGGLNFAKEAFKYFNKKINFITKTKDGRKINKGKVVATIVGNPKEILKSERVALNFLSLISGVATITNKFVSTVNGKSCRICCTRKTLPNLRLVQKYAVKLGGGLNHRYNLSDEILIKDNHIKTNGNIKKLVERAIKNNRKKKITVEVDNLNQLRKIIGLKFHRVLFDNMSLKNLRKGIKISNKFYETEASGGITLKNVRKIASTGVKRISVGQITHSAPAVDFKLEI